MRMDARRMITSDLDTAASEVTTAVLGLESRSILKSIQTEDSKLAQSQTSMTQSDLAYFRARYNYYKLSLLRLPSDEREILDPYLLRFQTRIGSFETRADRSGPEAAHTPFLTPVENPPATRAQSAPSQAVRSEAPFADQRIDLNALQVSQVTSAVPVSVLADAISELSLLRLALSAELAGETRRTVSEAIDRTIQRLSRARATNAS